MQTTLKTLLMILGSIAAAVSSSSAQSVKSLPLHDGAHDFDFNFGVWRSHITRTPDPFAAPGAKFEMNGTVSVRRIWNGKGALEEIEADGAQGHWEGMTLFLYNPEARQWSQAFVNSDQGILQPPLIGSFQDGQGKLYSLDTFKGRSILVRGTWSGISANAHHYEEDYSQDGGRTWSAAFSADLTRTAAEAFVPMNSTARTQNGIRGNVR